MKNCFILSSFRFFFFVGFRWFCFVQAREYLNLPPLTYRHRPWDSVHWALDRTTSSWRSCVRMCNDGFGCVKTTLISKLNSLRMSRCVLAAVAVAISIYLISCVWMHVLNALVASPKRWLILNVVAFVHTSSVLVLIFFLFFFFSYFTYMCFILCCYFFGDFSFTQIHYPIFLTLVLGE